MNVLAVFIGGGLGSVLRYLISIFSVKMIGGVFPWGTLISNTLACLIMAGAIYAFEDKIESDHLFRFLLITGFCGGFSTFSTFSFETFALYKSGELFMALLNVLVSVVLGLITMYVLLRNMNFNA